MIKKIVFFMLMYSLLPASCFTVVGGDDDAAHQEVDRDDSDDFFAKYKNYSPEQLEALFKNEGLDLDELQNAFVQDSEAGPLDAAEPTRAPGSAVMVPAGGAVGVEGGSCPTLSELVDQQKLVINADGFIEWQAATHTSPQIASIPGPQPPFVEGGKKLLDFLETKVRGKRIEAIAMVAYVVYRQISYLYTQHIKEMVERSPLKQQVSFTYTETILGLLNVNSRALAYTDLLIRVSFCSMRMMLDLQACIKAFKRYEFLQDPEGYLRTMRMYVTRARLLFSDPLYYGTNVSLIKKVLIGLAVPFGWAGIFSQNSPGAPFHNPFFKHALGHATQVLAQEGGGQAQTAFSKRTKPTLQKKLFNMSGGIIRERLPVDMALWMSSYVNKRYVSGDAKVKPLPFFARKAGKYAIEHVYLHGLIYVISQAIRGGAFRACGWMGDKIGWLLSKLGFFKENPARTSQRLLKEKCVEAGILTEHQELSEVLVYPASVFPGAFVKAVRSVINKQNVVPVLEKDKNFITSLNAMYGMSVFDVMQGMMFNFMLPQQLSQRITRVKNAVSPTQWRSIMQRFVSELMLEIFFDRRRMLCQAVTEPLLSFLSRPVLSSLYKRILPSGKDVAACV